MAQYDFIIRKEHKLLRNIFEKEKLEQSENLKTSLYYQTFMKFVKVYILQEVAMNKDDEFTEIFDDDLRDFCESYYVGLF